MAPLLASMSGVVLGGVVEVVVYIHRSDLTELLVLDGMCASTES